MLKQAYPYRCLCDADLVGAASYRGKHGLNFLDANTTSKGTTSYRSMQL